RQTQQASDPLASGLTPQHSAHSANRRASRFHQMNVLAVSNPGHPDWRWRIVDCYGGTVEESHIAFPTIAAAVAEGRDRLRQHADRDAPIVRRRWTPGRWKTSPSLPDTVDPARAEGEVTRSRSSRSMTSAKAHPQAAR